MSAPLTVLITNTVRAHRRLFCAAVVSLALFIWTAVGAGVWVMVGVAHGLPDATALRGIGSMAMATTVFDSADVPAFTIFKEQRIEVPLTSVSPHLIAAILAVEDQRFFDHGGVDVIRVAGAAWKNVSDGWGSQGGSTITQQLARQSLLTREKTVTRKLTEIVVAGRLEQEFSKNQILELYLNKVYFGDGLYGVEAASLGYFGKKASELSLPEAALLAGLLKAPSSYAPTERPDRAEARQGVVLKAMLEANAITREEYDQALKSVVEIYDGLRAEEPYGKYFKEEVRRQLVERFGVERIQEGGLRVFTTIDLEMQKIAEAAVERGVSDIEKTLSKRQRLAANGDPLQGALIAIDPK